MKKATTKPKPDNRLGGGELIRNALLRLLKAAEQFEGLNQDQYERRAIFHPQYVELLNAWKKARAALRTRPKHRGRDTPPPAPHSP